jgi:hypothetical protein
VVLRAEGWENYLRQMLLNSYPQKMLKKTFNMLQDKHTSFFHNLSRQLLLKVLIVHMIRGFESNCIRQNSNLKEKDLEVLV